MANTSPDVTAAVQANNAFAFAMYKELCKKEGEKNVFFSPMSITVALAMTHLGAAGKTADEIKSALHANNLKDEELHSAFAALNQKLNTREESACMLRMANRVFARKNFAVKETFMSASRKHFGAEAQVLDFAFETEKSRTVINKWVEEETNQKIKDLIPPGVLTDMTAMVLVNAIYFKGMWLEKFDPKKTRKEAWNLLSKKKCQVDMMAKKESFRHSVTNEIPGTMYLEMPYKGEELSMGFILPGRDYEFRKAQEKVNVHMYEKMVDTVFHSEVRVTIPKFKIETQASLNDLLKSLGMREAFIHGQANFTNIVDSPDLHVSEVVHKAFVEVSEEGTEAAAATAVVIVLECLLDVIPDEFTADHPFIFVIKDNPTGAILFMGHVTNPNDLVRLPCVLL